MLTIGEIGRKAEELDCLATTLGGPSADLYRQIDVQWRLMAVEAVFMEATRLDDCADREPPPE